MTYWKEALKGALSVLALLCFVIPFGVGIISIIPRLFAAAGRAMGCAP